MTIKQALTRGATQLLPRKTRINKWERDFAWLEAEVLLGYVLRKDRTWLAAHGETQLAKTAEQRFLSTMSRRKKHEPVAYITGSKEFYGRLFSVTPNVLIPRPETEILIDLIRKQDSNTSQPQLIWDVGTGSGAIAVTLALECPKATVLATDASTKALAIARKNAKRLGATSVQFLAASTLDTRAISLLRHHTYGHALWIVANLPYLPNADRTRLAPDILRYEPHSALFAGTDGLDIIRIFLQQLSENGVPFEKLLLEYDPRQTKKLTHLAQACFPDATLVVHRDLAGRDRVLEITRSPFHPPSSSRP